MSIKLMKDLRFAELVNSTQAVSEAGKELVNNYRSFVYSNAPSCSVVNAFVNEAKKYSFDAGVSETLCKINDFINENKVSWKLASACESINANNSTFNYINKIGVQQVEKLLEMDERDVVSYIKAGSLKGFQYIPEFRQICKEVYKENITESQAPNYVVNNPISFVKIDEDSQYFNVLGKTFKISEGLISEAVCDDVTFNNVNKLLEGFTRKGEDIYVEFNSAHGDKLRFTLNEDGLELTNGRNINEKFDDAVKFMDYANIVSKTMNVNEKMQFMNLSSNIATVLENINNIVLLDCVKVLTAGNGTICAISEAKDNVNLTVFRSYKFGTSSKNYDFVTEALNNVVKLTGVDLTTMFEDRINEDCKKNNEEADNIREQLEANKEAQFDIRKKKIAALAEQYKNDPVRLSLLNKVAKDLKILEKQDCEKCAKCGKCKKECTCKKTKNDRSDKDDLTIKI